MNNRRNSNYPPGPKEKWLTGSLRAFQSSPLKFLTSLSEKYGTVSKFRLGPFQDVYLVNDPDLIKEILVSKQQSFIKSRDIQSLKSIVGNGLLTSEKGFHLKQRRMIQPAFKKTHITTYAQDMIDTTNKYISRWSSRAERLVSDDMMDIALGIISKTMFSMEFEEGASVIGEPMEETMRTAVRRMRSILPLPLWIPVKQNRKYKQAIKELDNVLFRLIKERKETEVEHEDLLGVLMRAKDETDGLSMEDNQLRDELMTIFLAGHETTANALTWTLYLLSQHRKIQDKLFKEIASITRDGPVKPEHFGRLTYAQHVISESLRLYPPAYVIGRQAAEDTEINGYRIKKGDMILMSQYVMQRNRKYYEDPHTFIPERFENDFIKTIPEYAYFPFGGGPRVCIGNHFAFMEAVLVLACLSKQFKFTSPHEPQKIKPQPLITLRPKYGLTLLTTKRR
ncbi:cytochrome P450 [Evansella cellulosilytica]|uniref:Cytochrome P450 n=1 Tax=Evansella cellulosilytica (strain ATCC 21833 / DSM 2522 / FERM P-1141 / JCM 9156 / N-4) TaxID=649639 RepID=E6TUW5_EVAC2|nr:cytochrome P450 [Evansella cellulosilytica]ADU32117.1 cytochrome P450 [Evansella cellulosilytica DSM 2522]